MNLQPAGVSVVAVMNEQPDNPNRSGITNGLLDVLELILEVGGEFLGAILEALAGLGS
jgi:hypothetical protein